MKFAWRESGCGTLASLWADESGAIVSTELVLVGSLVVIAAVTGLSAVRDAVNAELAETAGAIGAINQSYSVGGTAATPGFGYEDK